MRTWQHMAAQNHDYSKVREKTKIMGIFGDGRYDNSDTNAEKLVFSDKVYKINQDNWS